MFVLQLQTNSTDTDHGKSFNASTSTSSTSNTTTPETPKTHKSSDPSPVFTSSVAPTNPENNNNNNSAPQKRPSAMFLTAAADPYDHTSTGSSGASSEANTPNASSPPPSQNASRTTSGNLSGSSPVPSRTNGSSHKSNTDTGSSKSTPSHSRDNSPSAVPHRPAMPSRRQSSPTVNSDRVPGSPKDGSKDKHKSRFSLTKSLKKATHWDLSHSPNPRDAHKHNQMANSSVSTSGAVHLGFSGSDATHHRSSSPSSFSLASRKKSSQEPDHDNSSFSKAHKNHGSMMELKRFFKGVKPKKEKERHGSSNSLSTMKSGHKSNSRTEFNQNIVGGGMLGRDGSSVSLKNMPFAEEGFKKYGKVGRMLGSGAGGSVRLMKRASDDTTFAIKEFRPRHANESQKEYAKKVTAEFCIGSTLHHPNIIETLDIIQDDGKFYEVMEYCPFDFFAIVMSGKMTKGEVSCTFKQILNGVTYLHKMGLAHRDLKLDNCVVTSEGVVKIIDFGSAAVFKYPFENEVVKAKGVVGSDPYLAPEVLTQSSYDPQPTDIWSLAIIYCCMTLRRFPWKVPKMIDPSFKLFATEPTKEEQEMYYQMSFNSTPSHQHQDAKKAEENKNEHSEKKTDEAKNGHAEEKKDKEGAQNTNANGQNASNSQQPQQKVTIKGPWRLLRLLPHESRHIIGRMLEIDPTKRATLSEIWADSWIQKIHMCTVEAGKFVKAGTHSHTFVREEEAHLEAYKK